MAATPRRTKIVATIGPASCTPEVLRQLVEAGMDGARLNLSHGTHDEHRERARLVRAVEAELGRPIALIADLQGPKLRIGELESPVTLSRGEDVLVAGGETSNDGELPVSPAVISEVLQPGHEVLIDDGLVRLRVEQIESGRARCAVVTGGVVSSHKGVNLPGVPIPIPSLTRKDMDDLELALELAVDALIPVLAETDAVMVARGDLGVEIGVAALPLLQKRIIVAALERGKPVITATQMLESMIHQADPTRAEASDVANAILDGSSALMLSGETAIGEFPVESVAYMDRIARAVEPSLGYRHELPEASEDPSVGQAMSNAACDVAEALGAEAILVPTYTGRTASVVARLRPRRPIVGLTHHDYVLRQMALEWGVTPLLIPESADVEDLWSQSLEAARAAGLVSEGDRVVITAGTAVNIPGATDLIKVTIA